jgi:two-component system OmpR family sensor kinase
MASDNAASELARLRELVDELRHAVRARDDFIAIAAHELRNPMTPILGVAELALITAQSEGTCSPRLAALLESMQRLVHDYIRRATRLLDVSRIESGNLHLEPSVTDLSAIVLSVAQRYEVIAAHGCSLIELDVEDGLTGVCDPLAIEQVVENLLGNALKFGMGKPVTLRLRSEGKSARLEVQDRGIGIRPDQQARIFGRFEQVVGQHWSGDFGVGLWVANHLVAAMHGQIAVSSHVGEGSTFTVTIPLSPPSPDRMTA